MDIEFVIQELLYTKNFITIPNLGSLVSKYQSARIIKSDQVRFTPPQKSITFNSSIVENDDTLLRALVAGYEVTEEIAKKALADFVLEVKAQLKAHNSYKLGDIGVFYYDTEKAVQFTVNSTKNYLTDTFGLGDFNINSVPQEKVINEAIKQQLKEQDSVRRRIFKTLFIAFPIVLAIILIPNILHVSQSASLFNWFETTEVEVDTSQPNKPLPEHASAYFNTPEPSNAAYDMPLNNDAPKTFTSDNPVVEPINNTPIESIENSAYFYIIVASYASKWKANKFVQQLQEKSYNAGVVEGSGRARVYVSQFYNREEAVAQLENVREINGFESAWLLTVN